MANGRQLAEEYAQRFTAWMASKTDDDFRNMVMRGMLSRVEIAKECSFGKSVLSQNSEVRKALADLEASLRERRILPPVSNSQDGDAAPHHARQVNPAHLARDAERLSRSEQDRASLRAENAELKRQLARFTVLQEVLAETGRLPR